MVVLYNKKSRASAAGGNSRLLGRGKLVVVLFLVVLAVLYQSPVLNWDPCPMLGAMQYGTTRQEQPQSAVRNPNIWQGLYLQDSELWQILPIAPKFNPSSDDIHKALDDVFRYAIGDKNNNTNNNNHINGGGWIHVNPLPFDEVNRLRQLGTTIMQRKTRCQGKLQVRDRPITVAPGLVHCFWDKDMVSRQAIRNFAFEYTLWGWVLQQFETLEQELQQLQLLQDANKNDASPKPPCHLAFLDIGVNVGDWASPLRLAFPTTTPYFGIEGSPATAAIATANMRTSIEHIQRQGGNSTIAPTAMLPFSLLSKPMIENVQTAGYVCFEDVGRNLGGQGIVQTDAAQGTAALSLPCKPSLMAGGTLLPHALQALIPLQLESSCPGRLDWPRIYIAKLDIEGFEYKTLASAMDWLMERPPCYLMIEFHPKPQNGAIMELLLDVGYDSLWRSHNTFAFGANASLAHEEFPPASRPFWSKSHNSSSISLHEAVQADLKTIAPGYKDYIFGFEHRKECLRRLME